MNTSDIVANESKTHVNQQKPVLDVGLTLREAREHLGMSMHDVAERIKFAPKQVEALEANDFAHLPQAAFLRGFVRSYARVLQLDEAALIAALPVDPAKQAATRGPAVNVAFPTVQSLQRINLLWLVGALGIAIVLGLFVLLHEGAPKAKPGQVVVEPVILAPIENPGSAVPETESQVPKLEAEPVVEPANSTDAPKVAKPVIPPVSRSETAPVATVKPPAPSKASQAELQPVPQIEGASAPLAMVKPPIPLEILKRRPLHLIFNENSWAEVIDVNGMILLSRNNSAGTEKWVGGPRHEPYEISIAHPADVKLYYRGKEVDLSLYAGKGVAHFKLE